MKKALIYFLVACFLSGSVIAEAFKVPLLISHYHDHVSRNPKVGLINFLSMHYWGNDIKDHDQDQDMKLPFKKIFHSNLQILFCNTHINHLPKNNCCFTDRFSFFYSSEIIDLSGSKLYRPPQILPSV